MVVERCHLCIVGCYVMQAVGDVPFFEQLQFGIVERCAGAYDLQCGVGVEDGVYRLKPWGEILVSLALSHVEHIAVKKLWNSLGHGLVAMVYHAYLCRVGAQKLHDVAFCILAHGNDVFGLGNELALVLDGAVIKEHALRVALESHVVYCQYKRFLTPF